MAMEKTVIKPIPLGEQAPQKKFYFVAVQVPKEDICATLEQAQAKARTLAAAHPTVVFTVVESVDSYVSGTVPILRIPRE